MADKICLGVVDIVITTRFVEIETKCPKCHADLTQKNAMVVWEYQDQKRHGHFDKETNQFDCNENELPASGEGYLGYTSYGCTGCGFVLVQGDETDTGYPPTPASEVHAGTADGAKG